MKLAVLIVLAFGALASATSQWTPGKELIYEYKTRTMTAIPYIKHQVSGVGLRAKVLVQVKSPSELLVKMTDIGIGQAANEEVHGGWRKEVHLSYSPLESSEGLSLPFKVILKEGQVVRIETTPEEPVYIVNLKRALASQLSLNLQKVNVQQHLSGNAVYKNQEDFFVVEEEPSIAGECRTMYTVVPLPEYTAEAHEADLPHEIKEKNQNRPAYMVTKTKDFTFCNKKPVFIHSSVVDVSEQGSSPSDAMHKRFSSRTGVSRYLIRGEPRSNFVVERVWTEGEIVFRPFSTKTESIFIASNQTLVLIAREQIRNPIPEPSNTVSKSLVFEVVPKHSSEVSRENELEESAEELLKSRSEYSKIEEELLKSRSEYSRAELKDILREKEREREREAELYDSREYIERVPKSSRLYPKLTKRPQLIASSGTGRVPVRQVKEQIKELVNKVEEEIESMEDLAEKEPATKIIQIARALMVLNLEEIEEVYREIVTETNPTNKALKTKRSVLLDSIAFCGTNPCIMLLKEKIQKREIRGERAAQLLMTFPVTLKTPTPEILKELVDLTKSVKNEEQVWFTALLSTSTLINRACVNPKARRHQYAVSPLTSRPWCTPQDSEYILSYIRKELQETHSQSKLMVLLQALGNIGSTEIFEVLRPVIQGTLNPESQVRSSAIFALVHNLPWTHRSQTIRNKIFKLLKPIFSNPMEPIPVRISAFVGLVSIDPSEAFFTEAATSTWFTQSQHVNQFVYSTLANLANSSYPLHLNVSRKAALALPLAKPYKLGAQYSQNVFFTHVIPERRIGSSLQWAQISGKHSIIPEILYLSLKNHMGGFDVRVLEMALQSQGVQSLINRIWGPEKREELTSTGLNIHTRKDKPLEGMLWVKLISSMERAITLNTLSEWAKEGLIEYNGEKQYTVNYQKTLPLDDVVIVVPAHSGLPVYIARKLPVMLSIRGTIELEMQNTKFSIRRMEYPKEAKIKLNLKPFVSFTRLIEAGVASPLLKKVFLSGYKSTGVISLPGKLEVKYLNREVEIKVETATQTPSKMELIKVKSYPFTGKADFFDFTKRSIKPIYVQHKMPEMSKVVGLRKLGLAVELECKMDEPYMNFAGLYHVLKPHNFLTATQFLSVPHNLRAAEYKVVLDLQRSETKALKAKIQYSSSTSKFSLTSFEEEERLERTHYKRHNQKTYSSLREQLEEWYTSPKTYYSKNRYEEEPLEEELLSRESEMRIRTPERRRRYSDAEEDISSVDETEAVTRSYHAEFTLEGSNPRRARSSLVLCRSVDKSKQKMSFMFERESASNVPSYKIVANAQMKYPRVPLKRSDILQTPMTALGFATVRFGRGESAESQISARIVLSQTQSQREAAERSSAAKECSKEEQEGSPYSAACRHARLEASALNKLVLDIEGQNIPRALKNFSYHVDDYLKHHFYSHMSNKRLNVNNPSGKVKVIVEVKPVIATRPWPVIDAYLLKPKENTFFKVFKPYPGLEELLPLNAEKSAFSRAANRIMGYQYTPMCQIEKDWVTTFDNVSYKYALNNDYHLITKDCSKKIPVRVLAKQVSEGKFIKMNVGKYEVEITPERKVLVDGQPVSIEVNQEKIFRNAESRKVLIVVKPRPHEVKVIAPIHGVEIKSDGKHFGVLMSNMYRGRVCGLCGDMDGEKVAEYEDPEGCVRKTAQAFASSYALGSSRSSEPAVCVREGERPRHLSEDVSGRRASYNSRDTQYVTKVVPRGEERQTCFSVKPVPECPIGTMPTRHVTKEIGFHCIRDGRTAQELSSRARHGILQEMFGKSVDFTEYVSVPESCESIDFNRQ